MEETKTVSVAFRVTPRFKRLLGIAAAREHRSLTNMLETLVYDYAARHGLPEPESHAGLDDSLPTLSTPPTK